MTGQKVISTGICGYDRTKVISTGTYVAMTGRKVISTGTYAVMTGQKVISTGTYAIMTGQKVISTGTCNYDRTKSYFYWHMRL